MSRGEIYWADLGPPAGRRLVCILTRDAAIPFLTTITCAPISRTVRGIRSEVSLGADEGLGEECAASCDNVLTIGQADLDPAPVGRLSEVKRVELDQALRYALEILY